MVQQFVRNDDGTWNLSSVSNLGGIATLTSIGIELPLAEIYERVEFAEDASAIQD